MFAIVVERPGRPRRRATFDEHVEIGRSTRSDLVLAAPEVSARHARIEAAGDRFLLIDVGSDAGVMVNGTRVANVMVGERDRIEIGPFVLSIEADAAVDATEERLLAAIAANDPTSRNVYADWLEQNGEIERAEFLRTQELLVGVAADAPQFVARSARLRELAESIELSWRWVVARPAVENCSARWNLRCPKAWDAMQPTERADVRYCDGCRRNVVYVPTIQDARRHVAFGDCVAIDVVQLRAPNDLAPPLPPPTAGMPAMPPSGESSS